MIIESGKGGSSVNYQKVPLQAGLYLVGVPIGTARDITLRALDTLASADLLAAEDTRSLRRLMDIHGIALGDRPLVAYHDHNGDKARPRLLRAMAEGRSVAYASEAGMPLLADPGFDLVRAAREAGHMVTSAPGPSAAVTALALAGLGTDRFLFAGFLPNTSSKRRTALRELAAVPATLMFYESPKRLAAMLRDAAEELGPGRPAVVARELTKRFEEVRPGTLAELAEALETTPVRGEIVVLIDRGTVPEAAEEDVASALVREMLVSSVKDASETVARRFGLKKRDVYQKALELRDDT